MTRYLYLSPHLDDAVLSAGGTIASRLEARDEVAIVTVFSGEESGVCARELAVYDGRRAEDRAAIALLSAPRGNTCETIYLGLADAPFRDSYYSSFETIVNGPLSREANAIVGETLRARLSEVLACERPDVLVTPLAVGRHVDHRLVFETSAALGWEGECRYYEDRPYAFVPGAVDRRWSSLGALPDAFGAGQSRESHPPLSFLADYRQESESAEEAREVLCWRWKGKGFEQSNAILSAAHMRRRSLAIAAYQSQLASLFDAVAETAEEAIATCYGSRSEVEWRPSEGQPQAAVVDLPAKES